MLRATFLPLLRVVSPTLVQRYAQLRFALRRSGVTFAGVNTHRSTLGWWQALPLLALLLAPGCLQLQNDEEQQTQSRDKLMKRHDELMVRMDELNRLRQQLARRPDTAATAPRRRALLTAETGMMDWMHQYREPADTTRHERIMAYYQQQFRRIDSVGVFIERTIDSARAELAAAPATR